MNQHLYKQKCYKWKSSYWSSKWLSERWVEYRKSLICIFYMTQRAPKEIYWAQSKKFTINDDSAIILINL